jgi:maleate cis-trans isomerase
MKTLEMLEAEFEAALRRHRAMYQSSRWASSRITEEQLREAKASADAAGKAYGEARRREEASA